MSDDLTINVDYLVEFLAVARDWHAAHERRPAWPEEDADLHDACARLFTSPEPAPPLPAELVPALQAWRARTVLRDDLSPEVRRLAYLCDRLLPAYPDPPRCAVPGCGASEGVTGLHLLTRTDAVALAVCPAHRDWLLEWNR